MDHLTEPGIRNHLIQTLEECKHVKFTYYTTMVNSVLFVAFILLVGAILHFKKKTKLTDVQKKKRYEEDRLHIVNRLRSLQLEKISPYKLI
jgi:hypothetical protein